MMYQAVFDYTNFGNNLRKARSNTTLTQQNVADALGIKCYTYADYERSYRRPRDGRIVRDLAELFKIDITDLVSVAHKELK